MKFTNLLVSILNLLFKMSFTVPFVFLRVTYLASSHMYAKEEL